MSWIPGWGSVTSAHVWSNFYFGASIVALILLGVFEVISHRYSERKDELADREQTDTQRRHDEEMTRLHVAIEASKAETAKATARAAEAQLALTRFRRTRRVILASDPKNIASLKDAIRPYKGTTFDIGMGPNDGEVEDFVWDLGPILWDAGWIQVDWMPIPGELTFTHKFGGFGAIRPTMGDVPAQNVLIELHEDAENSRLAANALADALTKIGIEAHVVPFNIHNTNTAIVHILVGPRR